MDRFFFLPSKNSQSEGRQALCEGHTEAEEGRHATWELGDHSGLPG